MAERLGDARLLPAARPVGAFITPAQIEAQKPAQPSRLAASNSGIGLQATAAKPNVPGYNPGEQLGEAMQAFGANLSKALGAGLELYASHEYQAGQNEVMKAQTLVERQVEQSGKEYAADNRALSRVDPYAAMAMDQTNPFRHAGRQMALSQLAAGEVDGAMQQAYRNNQDKLNLKDPTDPALNNVKAEAISSVTQRFGLDPTKEGFARFFLPAMNRSWERVTAQHIESRNNYLKDTIWRESGVAAAQMLRNARRDGLPLGQVIQRVGELLDERALTLGLENEPTKMKEKAISYARQLLADSPDLQRQLLETPVGAVGENGYRTTAAQMFALETMEDDDKYGEMRRRARDRELQPLRDELTSEVGAIGLGMDDGPDKGAALQGLLKDPRYADLPLGEKLEIIGKGNQLGEEVRGQSYDPAVSENFISNLDRDFGFGSERDLSRAEDKLAEVLKQTPQEDRARVIKQFADWKNAQQKQPWDLINPAITNKIKANLALHYPDINQTALRGAGNLEQVLAWGDANSKESASRQLAGYRTHVLSRLDEARTQAKRDLTDSEAQGVISKAIAEYSASKDDDLRKHLYPGSTLNGGGGGGGAGAAPAAAKPTPPPGRKPSPVQGVAPTLLDNMPDRQTRLKDWRSNPLLTPEGTRDLTLSVLNGGSFPAAFRRAAKDAGTTPEQLLIQQADFYPGAIKLNTQQRNQLLKQGTQAQGLNNNRQSRGSTEIAGLLQQSAGWILDVAMGTTPAMARTSDADLIRRYNSGSNGGGGGGTPTAPFKGVLSLLRSGEGGWDSANRGTAGDTPGGIRGLSRMTLGQWKQYQAQGYNALGAYQFIPRTLQLAAKEAGISDSTVMTPAVQDRLAVQLMVGSKRPALASYLQGKNNNLAAALDDLALEWASVHTARGGTAYAGIGGNAASISRNSAAQQLQRARQLFLGGGGGASPRASVPAGWNPARTVASASGFGTSESFRNGKGHEGMDLSFAQGTPLAFSVGGQVLKVYRTNSTARESNGGYGNYMDIRLDNGKIVRMAHLSQIPQGLNSGSRFTPGQSIALAGGQRGTPGAGRSTGAHLHFEEHAAPGMGVEETTRGKLNPARQGGALDYLIWRGG